MSITRADIKNGCFVEDVQDAQELALTNKGLVDLGCVAEAVNLTSLNLAFNALVSVAAVSPLTGLTSLNLSHNKLAVCSKVFASLTHLTHLNVSHNLLVNISGLSSCTALQELWLQSNRLASVSDLAPLSSLPLLIRMVVSPNPLCKKLPPQGLRPTVTNICSHLQVLDGLAITAEEREAAAALGPLSDPARRPSSEPRTTTGMGTDSTEHAPGPSVSGRSSAPSGSVAGPLVLGLAPPRPHPAVRTAAKTGNPTSQRIGLSPVGGKGPPTLPLAPRPATGILSTDPDSCEDLTSETGSVAALSWTSDTTQQQMSSRRRAGALRDRDRGVPRIKHLPPTSRFQTVLAALPQLSAKLPPDYTPNKLAATRPRKPEPLPPPPDAMETTFELRYLQGSRGRAVRTCKDGSLCISWPSGDIAVTVDADHATAPPSYRMLALYRGSGNVAVSWGATGGFVQYPSGTLCLNYNGDSAGGTLFSPTGAVLFKWSDSSACDSQPAVHQRSPHCSEPSGLGALGLEDDAQQRAHQECMTDGEDAPAGPAVGRGHSSRQYVDMALDAHMGVRFVRQTRQLEVWLACEGVQYRAVCGHNSPGASWQLGTHARGDEQPRFCQQLAAGVGAGEVRQALVREHTQASGQPEVLTVHEDAALTAAKATFASIMSSLQGLGLQV